MSLSWEAVKQMAEGQVRFARLPLSIRLSAYTGPCISVATHEMVLPESILQQSADHVRSVIGHELGHPLVFPRNRHWSTYYQLFAEKLGCADPHGLVNVIGDLFVNAWNATRTPWRTPFRAWARGFYIPGSPDARWRFLTGMMQGLLDDLDGKPVAFTGKEATAFDLLFHDRRDLRARFEDLAELLWRDLGGVRRDRDASAAATEGSLPALDPTVDAEELAKWSEAVRGLGAGACFERLAKNHKRDAVLFDVAELVAFGRYMVVEDAASKASAEAPAGPEDLEVWYPTDSPLDLCLGETIRQYGAAVPGLTTMKRVDGVDRTDTQAGRGTLFLIFDTSGSMDQHLGGMLVLGWAAALGARRRQDRVAAMEFSSGADYLLEPGYAYGKLKTILQSLEADGGTRLGPALTQVIAASKETRRKPTCVIFTDTQVADSGLVVLDLLTEIQRLGGKTLVCAHQARGLQHWVDLGRRKGLLEAFALNDLGSITQALHAIR